jgi:hypothetical protein
MKPLGLANLSRGVGAAACGGMGTWLPASGRAAVGRQTWLFTVCAGVNGVPWAVGGRAHRG